MRPPPSHFAVPVASVVPLSLIFFAAERASVSVTLPDPPDGQRPRTSSPRLTNDLSFALLGLSRCATACAAVTTGVAVGVVGTTTGGVGVAVAVCVTVAVGDCV